MELRVSTAASAQSQPPIRTLGSADLDGLLALYRHIRSAEEPLAERDRLESVWRELVEDPKVSIFAVEGESELLASCIVVVTPNLTRGARPFALIENVVTLRDHRRCGLGRRVLQAALESCWQRDCYKVMLLSGTANKGAHAFYERLGFERDAKQGFLMRPPENRTAFA